MSDYLVAHVDPETIDEFRVVFNNCAKYLGLNVKAQVEYYTDKYWARENSNTCWKERAEAAIVYTVDPKTRRRAALAPYQWALLRAEIYVSYTGEPEAAGVFLVD